MIHIPNDLEVARYSRRAFSKHLLKAAIASGIAPFCVTRSKAQSVISGNSTVFGAADSGTVVPVAAAGGGGTVFATDNFNRANETPLATGNWTLVTSSPGTLNLASNSVTEALLANSAEYYWNANTPNADQSSAADITAPGTSPAGGVGFGVLCRASTSQRTFYRCVLNAVGTNNLRLAFKVNNGSSTTIVTVTVTYVAGATLILKWVGTTYTITYNGSQVATGTDSNIASGMCGICYSSTDSLNGTIDNWVGTNF